MTRPRLLVALLAAALAAAACCGTPSYTPTFWNDGATVQWNNNCYNYANNKRTDTFAQPGRASGITLGFGDMNCAAVTAAANADGIDPLPAGGACPLCKTKIALVIAPGFDYHWYRLDENGLWTHKPGGTQATNLDSAGNPITDPQTADRGWYTDFCGYFCICSSKTEGSGHEDVH